MRNVEWLTLAMTEFQTGEFAVRHDSGSHSAFRISPEASYLVCCGT
jgi:hypothetical protein